MSKRFLPMFFFWEFYGFRSPFKFIFVQNTIFKSAKKNKLLWENLTKDATDLYPENYKTLLRIIKEELSQW